MEATLATRACQSFEADGYYIAPDPLVDGDILDAALAGMKAVKNREFDTGVPPSNDVVYDPARLCKINNAHLADSGIYALVSDPAIGQWAASVTGATMVQVWASQLLIKPPGSQAAGHVGWHQDRQYWGYWQEPVGLFTTWIALSDVTSDSGPMRFVRGSRHWGFLDQGDFFGSDQEALQAEIPVPEGASWEEVDAVLPPGGASFHHCLTYHGSGPNLSPTPRCSVAVHMRTQEAQPVPGDTSFYTTHLDDSAYCPVIHA